jgi:cytoskeletal protein CcmA (bactofilin family)
LSFGKDPIHEAVDLKPRAAATIIASQTSITGDIGGTRPVRVEGTLKGSVSVSAAVEVTEGASIEGDVEGVLLRIAGTVSGNVVARELVELLATAVVRGDLQAKALHVIEGARLEGRVQMTASTATPAPPSPAKTR